MRSAYFDEGPDYRALKAWTDALGSSLEVPPARANGWLMCSKLQNSH
jgi:hypothetical protein